MEKKPAREKIINGRIFLLQETCYFSLKYQKDYQNFYQLLKSPNGLDFNYVEKSQKSPRLPISESYKNQSVKKVLEILKNLIRKPRIKIEKIVSNFPQSGEQIVFFHLPEKRGQFAIFFAIFKDTMPPQCVWYEDKPLWQTSKFFGEKKVKFIDLTYFKDRFLSYWLVENEGLYLLCYPTFKLKKFIQIKSKSLKLEKSEKNPIIKPRYENAWEAFNTFNPAALYEAGKVHILYRAQGYDYISKIGYAVSADGIHIQERLNYPIFDPTQFEKYSRPKNKINFKFISGGGYGGAEDPRVTKIGKRIYMTYVNFDGINPPRIALTSISLQNFLNRRWFWEKPIIISPPGVIDKSACLLPEKINNKYVIFHRIYPDILIDFVDDLCFRENQYLKGEFKISPRSDKWDSRKIGAGAPPIKTQDGWLLIYQGVDDKNDSQYKIGAMILDLNNPTKVLYRCEQPILTPTEDYENEGFKAGVVYPCGAVVIGPTLFVYYGGADSYVCVATANLQNFLNELKSSLTAKLYPTKLKINL